MAQIAKAASFADFLDAPARLANQAAERSASSPAQESAGAAAGKPSSPQNTAAQAPAKKEKVGLTIDPVLIDAVEDYIYRQRKQGRRLKKNDVYEAALRHFLGLEGDDAR